MDIEDELDEIISGAGVSSYSIIAKQILVSILASLIIATIGASLYGILESIRRGSTIIIRLSGGLYSSLSRTVPRHNSSKEKTTIVITGFIIITLLISVISILLLYFQEYIFEYSFLNSDNKYVFKLGILYMLVSGYVIYIGECLKSFKEIPSSNLIVRWVSPTLQIISVFIVSLFISNTIYNIFYALILAFIGTFFVSLYILFRNTSFLDNGVSKNIKIIIPFITFFIFTTASGIFTTIQFAAPNISMFTIPEIQAGAFGIVLILSTFVRIPLSSINQIFPQVATELYENDSVDKIDALFKSTSKIATFFMCIPLITFTVYHAEIIAYFFSEQYVQYSIILPIVLIGQVMAVSIGTVGLLIIMTDNERQNVFLQLGISVVSTVMILYLAVEYNLIGLAIGYAFILTFNNIVELLFLNYKENLWSLTADHIKILLLYLLTILSLSSLKLVIPIYVNIFITILVLIILKYIIYKYIINSSEQKAINTYLLNIKRKISKIIK